MARASLALLLIGACGRLQFETVDRDRDDDGIADDIDLCPDLESENQHDEDGDGAGDVCDPCPHLAGDATDADGDGVGDACDPQPQVMGEQIRAFFTFEDSSTPLGWVRTSIASELWMLGGDVARIELTADHVGMFATPSVAAATTLRVETELVVEAKSPPGGNPARNFAIIDNYDITTDTGLFFGSVSDYNQGPPATASILYVLNSVGNQILAEENLENTFRIGEPYHLEYTRTGMQRSYRLSGGEGERSMETQRADADRFVGIRTRGLTISFRYLVVIY